jgi:hypothetical protein
MAAAATLVQERLPARLSSWARELDRICRSSDRRNRITAHQGYKLTLQAFQSQRLCRELTNLAAEAQYQQIGQFFFDEMHGARNFRA